MNHMPVTLTGVDIEEKREAILNYFLQTYSLYEKIFELLKDDTVFYRKSELTRHPMIFYFGHTATFYVNKLMLGSVITERINPTYESTFAVGVDEMSWDDMNERNYNYPEVSRVRKYRNEVKELLTHLIKTLPLTLPITQESPFWIILMGIEHERIHIETSSVLHRQMPLEFIKNVVEFKACKNFPTAPKNELIKMEGETIILGKNKEHHLYGWDNEYGKKIEEVKPFEVSKYLVSNAEFLDFVLDNGYTNMNHWDEEGKNFLNVSSATHPPFWIEKEDGAFDLRLLDKTIELPLSWAVEVNTLEAMAFCKWKSNKEKAYHTLPNEAQWNHLYAVAKIQDVPNFHDNIANINFSHYASPCPVNEFAFGELYDIVGNVWQWTSSPMNGFIGFKEHPIYDDFSTPTFDGKHNILKGGSFASSGNAIMKHSRYAFRRHFHQHAGFRYIKMDKEEMKIEKKENIYEHDELVNQYADFQYGEEYFGIENFAKKTASLAIDYSKHTPQKNVLDIGCATGRSSFELANVFENVTAIDFSARFIQVAVEMQEKGSINFERKVEGEIFTSEKRAISDFSFAEIASRVEFWQGDACNLKAHFKGYDLILATNLIDRLYEPKLFLENIHERINEEGILVITSPYTWQEESTKKEFWLGGFKDEHGDEQYTLDGLKNLLLNNFELVNTQDVPFVIRETARKFQHTISQMSVWKKRSQ